MSWILYVRGVPKPSDAQTALWASHIRAATTFVLASIGATQSFRSQPLRRKHLTQSVLPLPLALAGIFKHISIRQGRASRSTCSGLACAFNIHLAVVKRIYRLLIGVFVLFNPRLRLSSILSFPIAKYTFDTFDREKRAFVCRLCLCCA